MIKIEKTLELNITHEILSLADSFWWFLQTNTLGRTWRPHFRYPIFGRPKSFATGLHINAEGKQGGGYDVCINSPSNFPNEKPRLLFMQFKAGQEKKFNKNSSSLFYGDAKQPNIHVEFDINSNTKKNQHQLLKDLASKAGNEDAVVYVFPRIVTEVQLQQSIGNLLSKTSIISIAEIDAKAKENGITINDDNKHKFRTCYKDFSKCEVNLLLLILGKQKSPGGHLGEIFAIRMYRALLMLNAERKIKSYNFKNYVIQAMIKQVIYIGMHFSISLKYLEVFFTDYPNFINSFHDLIMSNDLSIDYLVETADNESAIEIFNDILTSLSKYFSWIEQTQNFLNIEIPIPPQKYTIEIPDNGIRFTIEKGEADLSRMDLNSITYSYF